MQPLINKQKYSKAYNVRITEEDGKLLELAAQKAGKKNLSEYVRQRLLNSAVEELINKK